MVQYVVLGFINGAPEIDVSHAPKYGVGSRSLDGTQVIVGGDFTPAQVTQLQNAGKTLINVAAARTQTLAWVPPNIIDGTGV